MALNRFKNGVMTLAILTESLLSACSPVQRVDSKIFPTLPSSTPENIQTLWRDMQNPNHKWHGYHVQEIASRTGAYIVVKDMKQLEDFAPEYLCISREEASGYKLWTEGLPLQPGQPAYVGTAKIQRETEEVIKHWDYNDDRILTEVDLQTGKRDCNEY